MNENTPMETTTYQGPDPYFLMVFLRVALTRHRPVVIQQATFPVICIIFVIALAHCLK